MNPCLLHSRQYRCAYEEMVNNLASAEFQPHQITKLRSLQSRELCTCSGPLGPSEASLESPATAPATISIECNAQESSQSGTALTEEPMEEDHFTRVDAPCKTWCAQKKKAFSEVAGAAQCRLRALAAKRGQLEALEPAISRLSDLVSQAWAARPPAAKEPKSAHRVIKYVRPTRYRRVYVPPPPPPPPPQPYAALRWPPLRMTMASLRGQPTTGSGAAQSRGSAALKYAAPRPTRGSFAELSEEDFMDLVDLFELRLDKLQMRKREPRGAVEGRHSRNEDEANAARQRPNAAHQLGEATRQRTHTAARKQPRGPKLRDSERGLGGSKCATNIAQLWPYI